MSSVYDKINTQLRELEATIVEMQQESDGNEGCALGIAHANLLCYVSEWIRKAEKMRK